MNYYELVGTTEGIQEVIFGSFIKSEVKKEKEFEQEVLRWQGYRCLKVVTREVGETTDFEFYGK